MIEDFIEIFIDHLRFEKLLSSNTVESYRRDLGKYKDYIFESSISDIADVSHEQILGFLEQVYRINSDSSVSRLLSTLRSFHKFLLRSGKIKKDPFSKIKNPKTARKEISILNQEEIGLFLESIPTSTPLDLRNRAMLELLYACGLRVSEVVDLKFSDIDIEEGLIRFIGKGSKERIAPVGETAKEYLLKYLGSARFKIEREKKTDYVFLNKNGGKITRQGLWKVIKKYANSIRSNKNLYPHLFRHSFATHMLEEGADLRTVQELLGHSSISTTEIYTNLDKKHIKDTYFKYHPVEKRSKNT